MESNNLLCDEQNGFIKDRNCVYHLYALTNIIETRKKCKLDTYVSFIDFSKAYDRINR